MGNRSNGTELLGFALARMPKMIKQRSQVLCVWFMVWDVVLTALAWLTAYFVRFQTGWIPVLKTPPEFVLCVRNIPLLLVLSAVAFRITGQYEIHRLRRFYEDMVCVVKGALLVSLLMMGCTFYLHDPYESRMTMILFTGLTVVFLLVMRRGSWVSVQWLRSRGYNQAFALVVGTGRVARATARTLRRSTWLGIKPLGFIEDEPSHLCEDLDILGGTDELRELIQKYRVAYVFICLPMQRSQEIRHVYDVLSQELVEVRLVMDMPGLAGVSLAVAPLDNMTIVSLRE